MKASSLAGRAAGVLWVIVMFTTQAATCFAQVVTPNAAAEEIRIVDIVRTVEFSPKGSTNWRPATLNQPLNKGDRVRTRLLSSVTIRWSERSVVRIGQTASFEILDTAPNQPASFSLLSGILYFFHRDRLVNARYRTGNASAGLRGTEFVLQAVQDGPTTLTVIEGEVDLSNEVDQITLRTGEQGIAEPGLAPRKSPGILVNDVIQWALHYPAVLDLNELPLTADERTALAQSLHAYRTGDLLKALDTYPANREQTSAAEKLYFAALVLAVGDVDRAQSLLDAGGGTTPDKLSNLANALRLMITTVKRQQRTPPPSPQLATEWLATSYYHQSTGGLRQAVQAAYKSVEISPNFGFGWARVAELEFGYGHIPEMSRALDNSLKYSPANPHALTLQGFVHAARNEMRSATQWFERAIEVDGAFANAWLGRGLSLIRQGHLRRGREDLLIAAAMEPQRAILRSYLAKAYTDEGDEKRAAHELKLARDIDPNDPTAWLYSALLNHQENRVNEAIRDVHKSQKLNDNRQVYRSKLLLDQDRAVRSVNLARLYADANLGDVAVREAGRVVTLDYADHSGHLFLANSYEVERRANLSNLRFETAAISEYLLANLLGPANGRLLAQPVTQLEYSTLFERNRLGVIANTEYFSRGAWHHSSAQYGTYNGSSYSLEAEYRSEPGERANQDLEIRQLEAKFKHDLTPEDSVYFHIVDYRADGGDITQHFDEREVSPTFRFEQKQAPNVLAGYHHQWSPENHTLFLAGRFDDTGDTTERAGTVLAADRTTGEVIGFAPVEARHTYHSRVQLYTAEAQHIAVAGRHSLIIGARGQWSKQNVTDRVEDPFGEFFVLLGIENPVSVQEEEVASSSAAIYAYDYLRLTDSLHLVGGLNFTHQSIPVNTATAPVTSQTDHQERVSPKAALIWTPATWSSFRASYTRSLTGAGLGQSVRLEPTHVAGLLQTFRAPAPLSIVGELEGADLETAEALWEARFRNTYVSVGAQRLEAERTRQLGLFFTDDPDYLAPPTPGLIDEEVHFREHALDFSAHQLVGEEWSFGVRYRLAYAKLKRSFPEYRGLGFGIDDRTDWRGWLHTLSMSALYRHRSGVFTRMESLFFAQDREQEGDSFSSDDFWQVNVIAGYRFPRQKAEIAIGVLNALDNDYRLDPINGYADQPRARTFYARLLIDF